MKKLTYFIFIIAFNTILAQTYITSNGCFKMYSNSYITKSGAFYSSWIKNTCDKYMYIDKSEYIIKFETSNSKGETRIFAKKKGIDFPAAFLAPGTTIYGSKKRSDGSSSSYDDIRSQSGEMGLVYEAHLGTIKDFDASMELKVGVPLLIGQNNGINFYATLNTYDKILDADWADFEKYKIDISFDNTKNEKASGSYDVHFEMVFCGIIYQGDVSAKNLNPYEKLTKSEKYKFVCNFTPRVFIRNKGTSSVQKVLEYNANKVTQLKSENLSLAELLDHEKKAKAEGSEDQAKAIHDHAFQIYDNHPFVAYSKANETEEIHDAITLYKKCISLSKEKNIYYYDSYYKMAVCNNHIANKLWDEKKYTEADKEYKVALANLILAEPLTNMSENLSKEKFLETKTSYESLTKRYINEKEKIKQEKAANQKLYVSLVAEGDACVKKSDYATAIDKYTSAINLNINSKPLQPKLTAAKAKEEARLKNDINIAEKKSSFETLLKTGDEQLRIEDINGAVATFQKALAINYNNKLANEKLTFAKDLNIKISEYLSRFSTIVDHQNKSYTTVKIGEQQWYVQNLRTYEKTKKNYWIEYMDKPKHLKKSTVPSYYNTSLKDSVAGNVYNLLTIQENMICKEGWHIPTVNDWKKLFLHLGAKKVESKSSEITNYELHNSEILNYEKNITKALVDTISGFGFFNPGVVIDGDYIPLGYNLGGLPSYFSFDDNKELYGLTFSKNKNVLSIQFYNWHKLSQDFSKGRAYPCKCVKD